MKPYLLIYFILVAGLIFIFPISSNASDKAEATPLVETQKEKQLTPSQPGDQGEKLSPKGLENQKSTTSVSTPVYRPPLRGAPGGRVGGGTRGVGETLITLFVLAPNHVGLTIQEQPNLYWYLSKSTNLPIEVTMIIEEATHPLLEKRLLIPAESGIHTLRLKEFNVSLSIGTQYRWFLAIVPEPDRRSRDIIAGGIIERIEPSEVFLKKLIQADKKAMAHIFAEEGIWYDTIASLSELIETNPDDTVLREQRAALLEQVGLSEVAQYDMKHGGSSK
jgi:hypothetical protein